MDLLKEQGKSFSAKINGSECIGKIQVENGGVYLCQNEADGEYCSDKLGYRNSWSVKQGTISDLLQNEVYGFKIIEQEEKKDDVLNRLPKYWAVKCDGSKLYTKTIKDIFKTYYKTCHWDCNIKEHYYGYDGNPRANGTDHYKFISNFKSSVTELTLQELIDLTTNNTNNTNNLTINENNYEKSSIKVQRQAPVITSGKRYTGNPISGGRSKAAISLGHLSNSTIYQ